MNRGCTLLDTLQSKLAELCGNPPWIPGLLDRSARQLQNSYNCTQYQVRGYSYKPQPKYMYTCIFTCSGGYKHLYWWIHAPMLVDTSNGTGTNSITLFMSGCTFLLFWHVKWDLHCTFGLTELGISGISKICRQANLKYLYIYTGVGDQPGAGFPTRRSIASL